ncbi:unnamed protein product [Larinioides sclopetarius]|uniref:Odorant-binding protein n=1 Tax=Larinioides sclopetarius TaxID=280406 RepID=A0AAV1ZSH6_9ARAC
MASESQKKESAAAREKISENLKTFDMSTLKLEGNDATQARQIVVNKLRKRFADLFLTEDSDQRNRDIYYCLEKGVCKYQERKLMSCLMEVNEVGVDANERCNEEMLEMKTCINKCLYKLTEKKLDLMLLLSYLKNCIHR